MGRLLNATVSGALVLGLAVAGCGGSSSTSQTSSTQAGKTSRASSGSAAKPAHEELNVATSAAQKAASTSGISLSSPAFKAGGDIPAQYTCDGADASPPLQWSTIRKGTAELVLFLVDLAESGPDDEPSIYWAVAGLKPTLTGLAAGALPAGAVVGRNIHGQSRYSICPPKGSPRNYVLAVYGLQHPVAVKQGFAASALLKKVANTSEYEGLTAFSYKR
jgi:phosphatidylethanolamine-binding protein (PEBP) family uncharacterized protein